MVEYTNPDEQNLPMKRPKIKRMDSPVYAARINPNYDASANERFKPLEDVPVFANDGWFLLIDGPSQRSWYQIQGKAYVANREHAKHFDLDPTALIRHFKWCLKRLDDRENEIGREATTIFTKMLWCMRKVPDTLYEYMHTQRTIQDCKDSRRDMARRMREFRAQRKAASVPASSVKE